MAHVVQLRNMDWIGKKTGLSSMLLDNWCLVCLIWLVLSVLLTLLVMAASVNNSLSKYFPWKTFTQYFSGILDFGSGDNKNKTLPNNSLQSYEEIFSNTKPYPKEYIEMKPERSKNERVLMFTYQDSGKIDETLLCPLQIELSPTLCEADGFSVNTGSNSSSCSTRSDLNNFETIMDSTLCADQDGDLESINDSEEDYCSQKAFIKWIPITEGQPSKYDLFLDKEESPRGFNGCDMTKKSGCPPSRSATNFVDSNSNVNPVRLTLSDSAVGILSTQQQLTNPFISTNGCGDKYIQRIRCDPSRFEYSRNRRYIAAILREGIHMKATLYLQLPTKPETSRCKMKSDLLMVLLKSFLWPWEEVHIKWVPSLLTWLITILTADSAVPVFKNQLIRSNYKAVLLLSKEAARQVRHQDLVFLFNLAMLMQTTPDRVLLLQQMN